MTERSARRTLTLWLISGALALLFLGAGLPKALGTGPAVEGFRQLGFSDHFRVLIGVLEVSGALGLLVPRLATWAAGGLAGLMVGAVCTHLATGLPGTGLPLAALVLLLGVALERWVDALFLDGAAPLPAARS
jgi:putative oxidoreductase